MKVHELTACPLCGSEQATSVPIAGEHSLRQCATCGTAYAPAYADPEDIYVDDYLLGTSDPSSGFGMHFDLMDPRFQEYLGHVARARVQAIETATDISGGAILDVGCGTGEVLVAARESGWQTTGVEPIAKEAAFARDERGLDVKTALLEESDLPRHAYDVVAAFHVLEHVPDPPAFLASVARWAKPGGYVVCETPNFNGRARQRSRQLGGWDFLRPLEHITHFTTKTMRDAFTRAGLEPVELRSPTWVTPPQTTREALKDLVRNRWAPGVTKLPGPLAWRVLHALERQDDRAGEGMVVFGVARVPG